MRAVILLPNQNSPGKKDWSGAFQPEALAFAKLHGVAAKDVVQFDLRKPKPARRKEVLDALAARSGIDTVVFFCHGLRNGLPQLGFNLANVGGLAGAIVDAAKSGANGGRDVCVVLYACSTADGAQAGGPGGDGGFADSLRDALCRLGAVECRVYGHDRAGHVTKLPFVRIFEGLGSPVGGTGGRWLVAPRSPLWSAWRTALQKSGQRLSYPFMTTGELHESLS